MNELIICEKGDEISFEDIHNLLYKAHEQNRKAGFNIKTAMLSGDELKEHIGSNGHCYVVLDGDKMVATMSTRLIDGERWWKHGTAGEYILLGIDPDYQGYHIFSRLEEVARNELVKAGCSAIEVTTAENNKHAIDVYKKYGFQLVSFFAPRDNDHYAVRMVKWISNSQYSRAYLFCRYHLKKIYVKLRFKKGRIPRF